MVGWRIGAFAVVLRMRVEPHCGMRDLICRARRKVMVIVLHHAEKCKLAVHKGIRLAVMSRSLQTGVMSRELMGVYGDKLYKMCKLL